MSSEASPEAPKILIFHKPKGVVVTRQDELGRKTVYECLPAWVSQQGWVPVGRLDRDSRGLLLFVREGALVERLGRPGRFEKVYEVWVRGYLSPGLLEQCLKGVKTNLGLMKLAKAKIRGGVGAKTRLEVVLEEGKNRQIRRIFGGLLDPMTSKAYKVLELKRIGFGPLSLDIPSGEWRFLSPEEHESLLRASKP